jgi:hypothetical protein
MPTYLPPRVGISLSEALAETYALSNVDEPVLVTLEIHHPDFRLPSGAPTAARVVNDWQNLTATLEAGAPLNAGEAVLFTACPFTYTKPEQTDSGAPASVSIVIDNVSRQLTMLLDQAAESMIPVLVIERIYLPSDTSAPHEMPPTSMYLSAPQITPTTVTLTASFGNLTNRRFPGARYKRKQYAALSSR